MKTVSLFPQIQPCPVLGRKLVFMVGALLAAVSVHAQTAVTDIAYGSLVNNSNQNQGGITYRNEDRAVNTVTTGLGDYRFDGPLASNVYFRRNTDSSGNGTPNGGADTGAGILAWNSSGGRLESNTILNNIGSGVEINGGAGNEILSNSISGNAFGITLTNGGNNGQGAPVNVTASLNPAKQELTVGFTVTASSQPSAGPYLVQVFYSAKDLPGTVQGVQLLETYDGVPAGQPFAKVITVPSTAAGGGFITVTATSKTGDTSAFSASAAFE